MRLGQLSRKLNLKPAQIAAFIKKEFHVDIDMDLNTRIEEAHEMALQQKHAEAEKIEVVQESLTKNDQPHMEPKINDVTASTSSFSNQPVESATEVIENPDAFIPLPVDPNAELIKAPKIQLEGLKVVGKIALPEKKVKEEPTPEELARKEAEKAEQAKEEEEYSIYKDKKGIYHFSQTQRQNRKDSLERIKREKQLALQKSKKVKHYKQIVETEKKSEPVAKKAKKQSAKSLRKSEQKEKPKGVWGKFVAWLNG